MGELAMPVFVPSGRDLVTQQQFSDRSVEDSKRGRTREAVSTRDVTGFTPIGSNKPLTVRIAHVYTGRAPGRSRRNDMLLTSAIKAHSVFDAAPRAINYLTPDVARRTSMVAPAATEKGTPVVFYSPAVTDAALTLTLEMGFDRFPQELFSEVAEGFRAIGQLPIFLPWSGYILAGAQLTQLIGNIGERLFETHPNFAQTATFNFNLPGFEKPEARFRIVTEPGFDRLGLSFIPEVGLVSKTDPNKRYDGDAPYVVISLDGARNRQLEDFTPTLASADLISRFFGSTRKSSAAIDAIVEAAKLANDMKFRREADILTKEADDLEEEGADQTEIDKLLEQRDALIANIGSDELRPTQTDRSIIRSVTARRASIPKDYAAEPSNEPRVEDPDHDAHGDQVGGYDERRAGEAARAVTEWRVARALLTLRDQINERFPDRSKISDGTIGDAAHASRASDHNPHIIDDGIGVVSAIDITHDPSSGCHAGEIVDALIRSQDRRIKYIIYNREIISSYAINGQEPWARRPYSGSNPHKKHFHLSVLADEVHYDNEDEWSVA